MAVGQIWHQRFMGLCNQIAQWSEDPHFQVGCLIVGEGHVILATGYNGFPRGISGRDQSRFDRESGTKFLWFEHAERNALYNAARIGVPVAGATLYVNRFPCADCSRAIIQSGLAALVCPPIPAIDGALDASFRAGKTMLEEAGLSVTLMPHGD
ncbi:MAG: deaminase [Rhodobacteraceae bacterium]|nr:deaminase [Paracoccaceae bacterium]